MTPEANARDPPPTTSSLEKPTSTTSPSASAHSPDAIDFAPEPPHHNDSADGTSQWIHTKQPPPTKQWWKFSLRTSKDDDGEINWWFASTAIPLIAATVGPLANVTSIAALVVYWRQYLVIDGQEVPELSGEPFPDPHWCYWINVTSLTCGFVGNFFLLLNFTQRVRYVIALPATIILWYISSGCLIAILICMHRYEAPGPGEGYTQGFWYAVESAVLYAICSLLLMVNMLGFLLGHYPETFTLTDDQRTLILQTMLFFIWLAGGGGIFSKIELDHGGGWSYVDALYFCDVTILTVGFGDLSPGNDVSRGLVFPYSVGGIIMLGLVISSIHKFVGQLGEDKVVAKHIEKTRSRTVSRTVRSSMELEDRRKEMHLTGKAISAPYNAINHSGKGLRFETPHPTPTHPPANKRAGTFPTRVRKPKLILLREEKERFEVMRAIQRGTASFKRWSALTMSVLMFGILWCIGAVVFYRAEADTQGLSYFQALYFCYVSLLTIGYGDLSPKSCAGRAFFVVWSLIAVPTMTVLISDMGDTVIKPFRDSTFRIADFTVLPKEGVWRTFLEKYPWLLGYVQSWAQERARKKRIKKGLPVGPANEDGLDGLDAENDTNNPDDPTDMRNRDTVEEIADEKDPSEADLAKRLAAAIRRTANDLKAEQPRQYSYEEWVEFTRLIRFTSRRSKKQSAAGGGVDDLDEEEEEDGELVRWDWIGEDSPMMASVSESEFVLDRLCESMNRYIKRTAARLEGGPVGGAGPVGDVDLDDVAGDDGDDDDDEGGPDRMVNETEGTQTVGLDEKDDPIDGTGVVRDHKS